MNTLSRIPIIGHELLQPAIGMRLTQVIENGMGTEQLISPYRTSGNICASMPPTSARMDGRTSLSPGRLAFDQTVADVDGLRVELVVGVLDAAHEQRHGGVGHAAEVGRHGGEGRHVVFAG